METNNLLTGRSAMWRVTKALTYVKEVSTSYPMVLSGGIMYSYFFAVNETSDALAIMWLLSLALINVLDMRTTLREAERARVLRQRERKIRQTPHRTAVTTYSVDGRRGLAVEEIGRATWSTPIAYSMTNIAQAEQIELSFGANARHARTEMFVEESSPCR
jgi:hypothetical protein